MSSSEEVQAKPWEQLEGESTLWFDRFEQYRLQGPRRTMMEVYHNYRASKNMPKARRASGPWKDAYHGFQWRERAAAWDRYMFQVRQEEWEQERIQAKRTRIELLDKFREKVEQIINGINPQDARWPDAIAAVKAVMGESRAEFYDVPPTKVEVEVDAKENEESIADALDSKVASVAARVTTSKVPREPDDQRES